MSRAKYSPEKQRAIMATFIEAATEIINEKGIDSVSIRSVASRAGYSSATMYLYFDDISQLIALASIGYLRDYTAEISSKMSDITDPKELYLYTWEAFCHHSLKRASIFMRLFFSRKKNFLDDIVKKYYSIFPHELDNISSHALSMLMAGDLYERNMNILSAYAKEVGFSDHKTEIINDMTVCYYRSYLETACETEPDEAEIDAMTKQVLEGISYLL